MRDFEGDIDGNVDLVRVCSWPEAGGLTAWRSDIAGRVGDSFSFTMWFEDQPISLSTVVMRPARTGAFRMQIGDASSFERFAPQWRWLLVRLGLVPFGASPLRGVGGDIAERADPWIGRFVFSVSHLMATALSLDRRLENVRRTASEWESLFGRVLPRLDKDLTADVDFFLSGPILADGASIQYGPTHDDVFHRTGTFHLELKRRMGPGSNATIWVSNWEGRNLVDLLRWLQDPAEHPHWQVLESDAWEEWFRRNSPPGELALPEDEVQVLELIGEALPYAWDNERLSAWAEARWRRS